VEKYIYVCSVRRSFTGKITGFKEEKAEKSEYKKIRRYVDLFFLQAFTV
jgi:hypothetical protein